MYQRLFGALLLVFAASPAFALFEEQAGENDWHSEYVGRATDIQLSGQDRLVMSTSSNVLSVHSLTSGNVLWRQILHQSDQLQSFALLSKPAAVVSLSNTSSLLRAWRSDDGTLLWEKRLQPSTQTMDISLSTVPETTLGAGEGIAVVAGGHVQVFSGLKGTLSWQTNSKSPWTQISRAVVTGRQAATSSTIAVAGVTDSGSVEVLKLNAATGNILGQSSYNAPRSSRLQSVVLLQDVVVALTSDGQQLCTASLLDDSNALQCQVWADLNPALQGASHPRLLPVNLHASVAVQFDSGILVVATAEGSIRHATFVPGATAVSNQLASPGDRSVAAAGVTPTGTIQVYTLSLDTAQLSQPSTVQGIQLLRKDGAPIQISNLVLAAGSAGGPHSSSKPSFQPLISLAAADGSVFLTKGSEVVWQREEALAEVSSVLFLDLPADAQSAEKVDATHEQTSIMDHIQSQFLSLKSQLSIIKPGEKQELARLKAALSDRLTPTRDNNGFRKLLVVLSRAGKLLGLHSGDGHVMWSLAFPEGQAPQQMFLWRSSHDLQKAPELLTLYSSETTTSYSIVDAHTGREVRSGTVDFPVSQDLLTLEREELIVTVLELPKTLHDDIAEQHIFLLIGSQAGQQQAQLLPNSPKSQAFFESLPTDVFFWQEERAAGTLTGFHVDKQSLGISQLWSNAYASDGVSVLQLAARDPSEHVYSPAKILGNKSLKIKYLNPSTVFIATGPPTGVLSEDLDSSSIMLTVQIVDTVTGAPIYRQVHKGCRGPVHAQFVENWVAYHYFDVSNHRWEMSILELYNKAQGNVTITEMVLGKTSDTMSSYQFAPLEVLRQSYFFDSAVKHMGVSQTMHGISNKFLLVGTLSDQVFLLDKRMLDPRRPIGPPSKDDQLEQLIPYQQTLIMSPLLYATHSKQVAQLSGIATAPANLESTSLMLAYGLDLFFARIQPNKAFDSLQDDFPYAFLVFITVMLTAAVFAFKRIDDKSNIQRRWL